MSIVTSFTRSASIDTPIVLAPMAGVSGGVLAAAVARAGGQGFIAAGYAEPSEVVKQFELAGDQRVGVGFLTWRLSEDSSALDAILERKPPAVFLSFGDASEYVSRIKASDAMLYLQVQTLAAATRAAEIGADVIVVQGSEAGGHGAQRALGPLLREVVRADLGTLILAAGGIGDGQSLASALALGADGVVCGTAFYVASEALSHPQAKLRAIDLDGDSTNRSGIFDAARGILWPSDWSLRAYQNEFAERWQDEAGYALATQAERDTFANAVIEGDFEIAPLIVGEGVGLIERTEPAGHIVERFMTDAVATIARCQAMSQPF